MAGPRRLATLVMCMALALAPAASAQQANPFPTPIGKPPAQPQQSKQSSGAPVAAGDAVGSVANVTQPASVARGGGGNAALKKGDPIRQGDRLSTGAGGALAVTFDDETTFSLSASASLTVDEFVYRPGQRGSALTSNPGRGRASLPAQTSRQAMNMEPAVLQLMGCRSLCLSARP